MQIIKITSANGPEIAVIPIVNPTVPNADVTSYSVDIILILNTLPILWVGFSTFGVYITNTAQTNTRTKLTKNTKNELATVFLGMFRLNNEMFVLPRIVDINVAKITARVVVLIPPPVDEGEAPINIIMLNEVCEPTVNRHCLNVLNPALLDAVALYTRAQHLLNNSLSPQYLHPGILLIDINVALSESILPVFGAPNSKPKDIERPIAKTNTYETAQTLLNKPKR
jgi:hypothetical protein